jgi:hypothetical protein
LDHGVSTGFALFDVEAYFPSFALFLDSSHSLILKPTGKAENEYGRIGIANFLRTDRQQATKPYITLEPLKPENVSFGPITNQDARTFVTIV